MLSVPEVQQVFVPSHSYPRITKVKGVGFELFDLSSIRPETYQSVLMMMHKKKAKFVGSHAITSKEVSRNRFI